MVPLWKLGLLVFILSMSPVSDSLRRFSFFYTFFESALHYYIHYKMRLECQSSFRQFIMHEFLGHSMNNVSIIPKKFIKIKLHKRGKNPGGRLGSTS